MIKTIWSSRESTDIGWDGLKLLLASAFEVVNANTSPLEVHISLIQKISSIPHLRRIQREKLREVIFLEKTFQRKNWRGIILLLSRIYPRF